MGLAVREPQPSDPTTTLEGYTDLNLVVTGAIESWKWVTAEATFNLESIATIGSLVFIIPAEVNLELTDDLFHFYLSQIEAAINLEIDVTQNFTEQLTEEAAVADVDPGDSPARIDNFEQEFVVSSTSPEYYKEFSYVGEDLVGYSVYTNNTKSTELFGVVFTFSSGQLIKKTVTRVSDGRILSVAFGYTGEELTSQTRSYS